MCDGPDLFLAILAILFPPLGVWVKRGICSADSMINIALCILGYLPGLLHSWYIISSYPDSSYEAIPDSEQDGSRVHVFYVQGGPPPPSAGPGPGAHSTPQGSYGTIAHPKYAPQGGDAPQGNQGGSASGRGQARPASNISPKTSPQPDDGGAGSSDINPPPSYSEVVKGDFKIQSDE